jgi:hypothetical protein
MTGSIFLAGFFSSFGIVGVSGAGVCTAVEVTTGADEEDEDPHPPPPLGEVMTTGFAQTPASIVRLFSPSVRVIIPVIPTVGSALESVSGAPEYFEVKHG